MKAVLGIAAGTLLLAACAGMAAGATATAKLEPRSGSNGYGVIE